MANRGRWWYRPEHDMYNYYNNDFRDNWGWGQGRQKKSNGVSKKKKTKKQKKNAMMRHAIQSTPFCTDDVSWLGDFVGAHPPNVGAHCSIISGDADDDDDDLMMSMIDLSQDAASNEVLFGSIRGDIVGIQYYKGTVNNGEMVTLEREPHNAYDKNAIRVINMDSVQVGHIKRELAKPLAFILDHQLARVEGVVPSGVKNTFKMPIEITLWGVEEKKNEALSVLRSHGFNARDGASSQASGSKSDELDYSHVVTNRVFLSPNEVRNELDKLFDTLEEGDKTTMAEPTQAIRTKLYPHQKQALNWMLCKENNEALPPFWEKRGNRYYNSLTVYTTSHRPSTVHGGILADDMGLGKTLEVISLILTNFRDGQPLAVPIPGRKRLNDRSKSKPKSQKSAKKDISKKVPATTEANQSEWDIFNQCLSNPEEYVEDSDEEREKREKNLKKFQSKVPKLLIRPPGSSSESESKGKSKSGSGKKSKSQIIIDNDDDVILKSARSKKKVCVIEDSDEESNSAKHDNVLLDSASKQNGCQLDDAARDILFDFIKSDSSSDLEDVSVEPTKLTGMSAIHDPKLNELDSRSNDIDIKSNSPKAISISDDSNDSKSNLQLVEYSGYPSIVGDFGIVVSPTAEQVPSLVQAKNQTNNSLTLVSKLNQSNLCVADMQMAEPREVTVIESDDSIDSHVKDNGVVIVIPDVSTVVPVNKKKRGRKSKVNKMDDDYIPEDKIDLTRSASLPPAINTGRPRRTAKKPARYIDPDYEDDEHIKPPAKRARHNSLPVKLEKPVDIKPEISNQSKTNPSIATTSPKTISSETITIVPASAITKDFDPSKLSSLEASTKTIYSVPASEIHKLKVDLQCQTSSQPVTLLKRPVPQVETSSSTISIHASDIDKIMCSSKPEHSNTSIQSNPSSLKGALSTQKVTNTKKGKLSKGRKCKGKSRMTTEFGEGAPALPSLPVDENEPPSTVISDDDDYIPSGDSDESSDDDSLPDLVMELPFNLTKAVISNCDSTTGRTKSDKPRTTLIVCPLSVMNNWVSQLEEHVREDVHLEIYMYYGTNRTTDSKLLENQDIVISTYGTIAADFKGRSPLRKVNWLRIILDEGHYIRNSGTLMAQSILELKAERKWVLSGTPIQNSIKDLYSLVNFLNISPLTDKHWWKRTIERPISLGYQSAIKRVRALMANIGLRRTKTQQVNGKPLVELPARNLFIETIKLTDEERAVYTAMQTEGKLIISRYFQQGTLLHHYSQVLVILLRLRQLCCHPLLCSKAAMGVSRAMEMLGINIDDNGTMHNGETAIDDETKKKLIDALLAVLNSGSDEECPICLDSLKHPVITPCAHVYCRPCIERVLQADIANSACPLCRGEIKLDKLIEIPEDKMNEPEEPIVTDQNWQSSSKVDALMKALVKQRSEDPTVKSIVVSQFTSLLTLIEVPLKLNGFKFARLDGTMTHKRRSENIEEFMDPSPDSPTIFLLSLKAGGVGLNLTAASRVFLMDPAWNPAAEDQCFDRCHRLGQTRDVNITKFLVEDSVEQRMLELQERKRALMQGAFGKKQTAEERRTNRINEIKTLLDL